MTTLHPTTIRLWQENCGYAISLWKKNTPYNREIFQTGVAVHYMLEMVGLASKAQYLLNPEEEVDTIAVIRKCIDTLATKGRAYDGIPEPPIPMHNLWEAKNLAIKWLNKFPIEPTDEFEEPFAILHDGNYTHYDDPKAAVRTIIDVVRTEIVQDEDEHYKVVTLTDYKSSWHTTPEQLDNLQRRCQAVMAWIKHDPDVIILQIANLRSHQILRRTINTSHERQLLQTWLKDIIQAAYIANTDLLPKPGINCINCPYVTSCKYRLHTLNDPNDPATQYATALATVKSLEPIIRQQCKIQNITTKDGTIGYVAVEKNSSTKDAGQKLLKAWTENGLTPDQLMTIITPSVTNIKKIAKQLSHDKDEQARIIETCTTKKKSTRFGIHK